MATRDILIVNRTTETLKFTYRFGFTASKKEHLRTLYPSNANGIRRESSFTYTIRENGTYEKIEVEYRVRSAGGERYEPANVVINADMMAQYSKISVLDNSGRQDDEAAGTAKQFRLETEARAPAPGAGWIASSVRAVVNYVRRFIPRDNLPR